MDWKRLGLVLSKPTTTLSGPLNTAVRFWWAQLRLGWRRYLKWLLRIMAIKCWLLGCIMAIMCMSLFRQSQRCLSLILLLFWSLIRLDCCCWSFRKFVFSFEVGICGLRVMLFALQALWLAQKSKNISTAFNWRCSPRKGRVVHFLWFQFLVLELS